MKRLYPIAILLGLLFALIGYILGGHLVVHYLDLARHEGASTFAWEAVKTNLGAWPWQAAFAAIIGAFIYPPTRHWFESKFGEIYRWIDGHMSALHEKLDRNHQATTNLHSSLKLAHEKMDHIITHSNDIPDFTPSVPDGSAESAPTQTD